MQILIFKELFISNMSDIIDKYNILKTTVVALRCFSVYQIIRLLCPFSIDRNNLYYLNLEIALAIPDSNNKKKLTGTTARLGIASVSEDTLCYQFCCVTLSKTANI